MLRKVYDFLMQCSYLHSEEMKKRCAKPGSEANTLFMELDEIALAASAIYHTAQTLQWKIIQNSKDSIFNNPDEKERKKGTGEIGVQRDSKQEKPTDIEGLALLLSRSGIKAGDIGGE